MRDKSGQYDKDSTKLVESTLLGNSPAILINKFESTTEKDIQHGIGFILKGIMMSVRNPLSHEKCIYTQEEAEVIILYINYLLNQIDHSGGTTKIQNIMELLYDEDFTDTNEYAELLLKEVPAKKRYDLIVNLYKSRANLPKNKLKNFISLLFQSLTKAETKDFIKIVSDSLLRCKNNNDLKMYVHYFIDDTYKEIDKLAQLRIENMILNSLDKGKLETNYSDGLRYCNNEGYLATWFVEKLSLLGNKADIINKLFSIIQLPYRNDYIFRCFGNVLYAERENYTKTQISIINRNLQNGNSDFYNWIITYIEFYKDETMIKLFGESYENCKKQIEENAIDDNENDGLPF